MEPLIIATRNQGKLEEIRQILGSDVLVHSLANYPNAPDVVEDGDTFEANAVKKAITIAAHTKHITLADDSGLVVDALNGAPGIYSARFSGEDATDSRNNEKLLNELKAVSQEHRTARFRCVIALATPGGNVQTANGVLEGTILNAPRGKFGFGYDPLFLVPDLGLTLAELPPERKNPISHRGRALQAALPLILSTIQPKSS